jgi:hypothetical protein
MHELLCLPKGKLIIELIDNTTGNTLNRIEGYNSLTLEAVKLLLGQLLGPSLVPDNTSATFPDSTDVPPGRPNPQFISSGPRASNSIAFIKLGYVEASVTASSVASPTDTDLQSSTTVFTPLTAVNLISNGVQFVLEYEVPAGLVGKKFYEAGLFTLGNNTYNSTSNSITTSTQTGCIMFSRKVHADVIANSNTTLRYTWTISMSNPE